MPETARVRLPSCLVLVLALVLALVPAARADEPVTTPRVPLPRLAGEVRIDGSLTEAAWERAAVIELNYETSPGENVPPPVRTTARVAYDDRYFYVAFDCHDPDPASIRAPYVNRDDVESEQDFVGVMLDTRHDGRSALELFVNPRGIQDDGILNDGTGGEDMSLDIFWDSAGRIHERGWTAEIRVPLASLRYPARDPQDWGVLLFRNYPRAFRHQIFNVPLPPGRHCTLCSGAALTGIRDLPQGAPTIVAPYVAARGSETGRGAGADRRLLGDAGFDLKWLPNADTAVDITVNPDFSQVEADAAQVSANQRFALFYNEKRPFFLEGGDLWDTPVQVLYSRTINAPEWGARVTGKRGGTTYTALVARDAGGGLDILPGDQSSSLAPRDFASTDAIVRLRHDAGASYVGMLASVREDEGGSFNRVAGPDFLWRPNDRNQLSAQALWSWTETPDRPDLAAAWDGRRLDGAAVNLQYQYSTRRFVAYSRFHDIGRGFRAVNGYVPQVGYRRVQQSVGWRFYPKGFFSRLLLVGFARHDEDRRGRTLGTMVGPSLQFNGRAGLHGEVTFSADSARVGDRLFHKDQLQWDFSFSPSRRIARISTSGFLGEEVDYENARPGRGGLVDLKVLGRAGDHLDLELQAIRSWLDIDEGGVAGRLFTENLARLRAVYTFSARTHVRAIAQYGRTARNPALYLLPVERRGGGLESSLLFAYKLNWQSVLFVGIGDERALDAESVLRRTGRQVFVKASMALGAGGSRGR